MVRRTTNCCSCESVVVLPGHEGFCSSNRPCMYARTRGYGCLSVLSRCVCQPWLQVPALTSQPVPSTARCVLAYRPQPLCGRPRASQQPLSMSAGASCAAVACTPLQPLLPASRLVGIARAMTYSAGFCRVWQLSWRGRVATLRVCVCFL